MIKLLKKQRATSALGLALDGNRLEAVVVRRTGGSLQPKESLSVPLALSPLGGDPELVGREIRNHLDQAGVRERRCVVAIPVSWVLTMQTKLPAELSRADQESFLQIEAERGFTSGHENLFIAHSISDAAGGEQHATLVAIPRNHLETLERALRAAQLKPLSFCLGVAEMDGGGKDAGQGSFALAVGSNSVELKAVFNGGILALRSLDGAVEADGAQRHVDADLVAREIRITLGQLPHPMADNLRTVRIYARGELAKQFMADISPRLQAMNLRMESMDRASGAEFSTLLPAVVALSPALAVAANYVRGVQAGPELLPPKVSQFQQFVATRIASKRFGWVAVGVGAAVVVVGGIFGYQQYQLNSWTDKKASVYKQGVDVRAAQAQIRLFGPWFDDSKRTLTIWKAVTEAFPEDGSVVARTLEIRNVAEVSCSGTTRDNRSYLQMLDKLSKTPGVKELNSDTMTGQQFGFKFRWEGDSDGN
jgi:hypothetical protein